MLSDCAVRSTQAELTQGGLKLKAKTLARLECTGVFFVATGEQMSQFPSWHKNTRRGAGKNSAIDDRYAYKHRSTQTDRWFQAVVAPLPAEVPLPRFADVHVRLVLKMLPLHKRPLPLSAWRLLMSFLEAERSFGNLIIPHFTSVSVFLCVRRNC